MTLCYLGAGEDLAPVRLGILRRPDIERKFLASHPEEGEIVLRVLESIHTFVFVDLDWSSPTAVFGSLQQWLHFMQSLVAIYLRVLSFAHHPEERCLEWKLDSKTGAKRLLYFYGTDIYGEKSTNKVSPFLKTLLETADVFWEQGFELTGGAKRISRVASLFPALRFNILQTPRQEEEHAKADLWHSFFPNATLIFKDFSLSLWDC